MDHEQLRPERQVVFLRVQVADEAQSSFAQRRALAAAALGVGRTDGLVRAGDGGVQIGGDSAIALLNVSWRRRGIGATGAGARYRSAPSRAAPAVSDQEEGLHDNPRLSNAADRGGYGESAQ